MNSEQYATSGPYQAKKDKFQDLSYIAFVLSISFLTLTFQYWFTSPVARPIDYGWFRKALIATAELDIHSGDFIAPVAYRLFTPFLANAIRLLTGVSLQNAFYITTKSGLYCTMLALGWLLYLHVRSPVAIALTSIILSFSFPFRSSIVDPVTTDPWTWFFLVIASGLALGKRWKWFAFIMFFGALNRETQILLIPAAALAVGFDRKNMLRLAGASLPSILLTLLLRIFMPVQGTTYASFYLHEGLISAIRTTLSYHGVSWIIQLSFMTFGTLWFIAMFMSRNLHTSENRFFWGLLIMAHCQLLFAVDVKRLVSIMLPLIALQTGRFLDERLNRHPEGFWGTLSNSSICLLVTIAPVILGWHHFVSSSRWRFSWLFTIQPPSWFLVSLAIIGMIYLLDRWSAERNRMSKILNMYAITIMICVIFLLFSTSISAEEMKRIRFEPGADSATLISATDYEIKYVIGAKADQLMTVELTAGLNQLLLSVTGPDGKTLDMASNTSRWTGVLPATGDCTVTITKIRRDEPGNPPFVLVITIPEMGNMNPLRLPMKITGTYTGENGSISVLHQPDGTARLYLSAFWRDHFGELCATVALEANEATYAKGDCVIGFKFGGDWVFVDQRSLDTACDFGANVTASGVYKVKNHDVPGFEMCP